MDSHRLMLLNVNLLIIYIPLLLYITDIYWCVNYDYGLTAAHIESFAVLKVVWVYQFKYA